MKSGCSFFLINVQFLHRSHGCLLPSVHKYIFPSEIAVSTIVEVAEIITNIAGGLFFKIECDVSFIPIKYAPNDCTSF